LPAVPTARRREPAHLVRRHRTTSSAPFDPICDPVIAGHIVKVDALHLTVEFAKYIAGDVDTYLKNNRLLP